jgi:lipopolysaccharide transport system permease protein
VNFWKAYILESIRDNLPNRKEVDRSLEITEVDGNVIWWLIDWPELWRYRDLFFFLVWRDIKIRYAQSILGIGWAIIQPVFSMFVYTIIFGKFMGVDSEGVPYAIFSFVALVPWAYFSSALTGSGESLVNAQEMITKVYFPRVVIPIAPVLGKLIDFGISFLLLFVLMGWYRVWPTKWALFIPVLVLLMMITAAGMGMLLTALAIQYRDIKYGLNFFVQLLMYSVPVVYPLSVIPDRFRLIYGLNPMVGVIEGFRSSLLGTNPMPWDLILVSAVTALILFLLGASIFRRMERTFADVA